MANSGINYDDWLRSLPLKLRIIHDRAYGERFYKKTPSQQACRQAGIDAVKKAQGK